MKTYQVIYLLIQINQTEEKQTFVSERQKSLYGIHGNLWDVKEL